MTEPALPITLVTSLPEFEKLQFKDISRLGEGQFGIVLKCQYKGITRAIKILESNISEDDEKEGFPLGSDVLKEALAGFELHQRLPDGIKEFFTSVSELIVCKGFGVPGEITKFTKKDSDLKEILEQSTEFYIIVQEYIENVVPADQWVSKHAAIDSRTIQSIMFQFVLALCYAQSILGFQHNDLKLQNIMFVENKTGNDIFKKIRFDSKNDKDDFEYVIPVGGVSVRIIDLGSVTFGFVNDDDKTYPKYISSASQMTEGYIPFEILLFPNYENFVSLRLNDADLQALFKIMINLVMHERVLKPDGTKWKLVITDEGDTIDYTEYNWMTTDDVLLTESLKNPSLNGFTKDGLKVLLADLFLIKSLDIPLQFPKKWDYSAIGKKAQKDIKKVFGVVTQDTFLLPYENSVKKYFQNALDSVKNLFPNEVGLHFLRKLGTPFFLQRLSFGLPEPFDTYCLANAIYHPFFAFEYWKDKIENPTVINQPLKGPLVLEGTDAEKMIPETLGRKYLKELEKIRVTTTTTTTTATKSKWLPWTLKKLQKDEINENWVRNEATEEELINLPDNLIDRLDDDEVLLAWAQRLGSKTKAKSVEGLQKVLKPLIAEKRAELGLPPLVAKTTKSRKPKKAKAFIYEQLENIEHDLEFMKDEETFDTESIEENLYLPLREMVAQSPQLETVGAHLGIDKPLFEHTTVDMTKRSNQIRLLHTLSILAEMAESKNITSEKIERCFVEWPPQPRYKIGEINEI